MATTDAAFTAKRVTGGSFLIEERSPDDVFTPEDFSGEHRQIAKTAVEFTNNEVLPAAAEIEAKNFTVTRALLRKAGELGLMAVDVPEEYGGLEMDKVTSALVAESISRLASFSVAFSAHVGIGTLPIVWYGTEAQKRKYLPKLSTGEWIGAYALSESSSASDALNARTRAVLSQDGSHYVLNGEKMWITNSGFADLFTVFAKVDGEKFSAFLIERGTPWPSDVERGGAQAGHPRLFHLPADSGRLPGPGGKPAGRSGQGPSHCLQYFEYRTAVQAGRGVYGGRSAQQFAGCDWIYPKKRKAFGKSISEFGLIQEKLAESAVGIFVGEAMVYRTIGMIDAALAGVDTKAEGASREIQKRIEEYAVECSIVKVWGSEMLDMVVDHVVQIFAGYGYVEEYPAERALSRFLAHQPDLRRHQRDQSHDHHWLADEACRAGTVGAAAGHQAAHGRSDVRVPSAAGRKEKVRWPMRTSCSRTAGN